MFQLVTHRDFSRWRGLARAMLAQRVPPEEVLWIDEASEAGLLAADQSPAVVAEDGRRAGIDVPRAFLDLAASVACHRDPDRWNLLYRSLWRIAAGERCLLERLTDDDVVRLHAMEKAVRRDRHKMTAFVRFRIVQQDGKEHYVAWHRPDHYIVRLTAPFFAARFACMHWTILTPDETASWDGKSLHFGPGVPASAAPAEDELESLWSTYYANIFNPARIKIRAMKRELPVRHWPTLPETRLIPDLLKDAPKRIEEMMRKTRQAARHGTARPGTDESPDLFSSKRDGDGQLPATRKKAQADAGDAPPKKPVRGLPAGWGAEQFIPASRSLPVLAKASRACRGCDLCDIGTQTVFGEGPADAILMFVGEQPGDQEDQAGKPFVGPSGQLLDEVLEQVGVVRDECYVTNSVKHFKWEPRGTRRIHAKPNAREIAACRPWLETEISIIKPPMIVCLGSTAAQTLLGRDFRVTARRGQPFESEWAKWTMATVHPSSLLRIPDREMREESRRLFVEEMKIVAKQFTKEMAERK